MLQRGIFYPELTLGAGARELSSSRKLDLQQFLVAVVQQRDCPLHVANLWNALYFNYDLTYGGFHADHIEQKRIPTRTAEARDWSLPVGGFVRVHTATACGDLLAEVLYKEGAHESLNEDGWLDPALSGKPAGVNDGVAGEPVAVVRERFVLDLHAFGAKANTITPKQYDRLCRRGRWVDEQGHLLMEAMYAPQEADLEDLDYYVDYLLKEHLDGLLAFCFELDLRHDEIREALLRSFDAVRELALTARELGCWRGKYFFSRVSYDRRRDNADGILGASDLSSIYSGLRHVPQGRERCYSPIGPRIIELLERDGFDDDEAALVRGCQYITAVCHANLYVADALEREQKNGILKDGTHLRLDDDWQGGGIWRAERVHDPQRYSLASVPALIPLGLGCNEARGDEAMEEPISSDERPIASSQHGFSVALTRRDRELSRIRLSREATALLSEGDVDAVLVHAGERERYRVKRDQFGLYGVCFRLDMHPGIILHGNVERDGAVVRVRTVPVTPPIIASDGNALDYETDLAVYEREMRLRQLSTRDKSGAPSLTELISRAFRKRGRRQADGARVLTISELATIVLGSTWESLEFRVVQQAVGAMGLDRDGADLIWRPQVTARTRSSDLSLLAAYGESRPTGRIVHMLRRHWVPMHLRHYTESSGRSPSAAKRLSYVQARKRFAMHGVLPEALPEGSTWVEPYSWGAEEEEPAVEQLQLGEA